MNRFLSMRSFRDFVRNDGGATAIEYALIAAGIAIAIVAAVMGLGTALQTKYQSVSDAFN